MKQIAVKGGVPGDLLTRLIKEFDQELSDPVSQIYRSITRSGKWPKRWQTEQGLELKKIPSPLTEHFARSISLTPFFSKLYEKVVLKWLLPTLRDDTYLLFRCLNSRAKVALSLEFW